MHAFLVLTALLTCIHEALAGAPSKIYGVNLGSWLGLSHIYAGLDAEIMYDSHQACPGGMDAATRHVSRCFDAYMRVLTSSTSLEWLNMGGQQCSQCSSCIADEL